jgi:retron-type reverse transcriptase
MVGIGIPQGSPISPFLMNLYLDRVDRHLEAGLAKWDWLRYERYADDMIFGIAICPKPHRCLRKLKRDLFWCVEELRQSVTFEVRRRGHYPLTGKRCRLTILCIQVGLNPDGRLLFSAPYAKW